VLPLRIRYFLGLDGFDERPLLPSFSKYRRQNGVFLYGFLPICLGVSCAVGNEL
jgi:hypothetical protein